jgi:putative colanic acid biosynthesis acetyltransferase WcaF
MNEEAGSQPDVPVINLRDAPGERVSWDRPVWTVYAWAIVELLVVSNPWQISSSLRVRALRWFGAEIGDHVVFRPRTRVKLPWKLHVGDNCWIGEGVWFHNQDHVYLGSNVVLSQETMLTTGSHKHRTDMGLITRPIHIEDGAWVTSRCMILGGTTIGRSAIVRPMSVVDCDIEANTVTGGRYREAGKRF